MATGFFSCFLFENRELGFVFCREVIVFPTAFLYSLFFLLRVCSVRRFDLGNIFMRFRDITLQFEDFFCMN